MTATSMEHSTVQITPKQRNRIVEENMGLVGSVVRRFANSGHDMEDLFQIGCLGLIKAVERFDSDFGVKLSTYAVPVIIGEIKRFLRDDGALRISRSVKTNAMHIFSYMEQTEKLRGISPTVSEIATHLQLDTEDVLFAMDAMRPMQYLQAEASETGLTLSDTIPAQDAELPTLERLSLEAAIARLAPRDRTLLRMRYYEGKTQAEIAANLSLSQVQVSRLEKKLLLHLRSDLTEN